MKFRMMTLMHPVYDGFRGAWMARCDCGTEKLVKPNQLRGSGSWYSCGCYKKTEEFRQKFLAARRMHMKEVRLKDPKNISLLREIRGAAAEEFIHRSMRLPA